MDNRYIGLEVARGSVTGVDGSARNVRVGAELRRSCMAIEYAALL
jgi:hypothetical protein